MLFRAVEAVVARVPIAMFLLSWIAFPLVLAALCLGCGLLVDRAARGAVPRPLLLPAGFAAVVVLATLLTVRDETAELAAPALAIAALAGLGLAAGSAWPRPSRAWLAPALAATLPLAALAAPVVLTGAPGFTGYGRIVDLAFQLDLSAHLVEEGRSVGDLAIDSSHGDAVSRLLGGGYPTGAQATLGATAQLLRIDAIWAWQPFMAWMGAMLGLALYGLLAGAVRRPPLRGLAAGVAAQPTILYSYALASGIKELAAAVFVALAGALLAGRFRLEGAPRRAAVAALALAAGLSVVNVGFLPWAIAIVAVALLPRLVVHARDRGARVSLRATAIGLACAAVVLVPAVHVAVQLEPVLSAGGPADLGNLAAPVPAWSAIGPWLTPDYRYPLDAVGTEALTAILAALAALLAAIGLGRAAAARDLGLLATGVAALAAVAVVLWKAGDWVQLKAFAVSAPLVLALAFAGAAALAAARRGRWPAIAAGGAVAVSVLVGNVLVYRAIPLAPHDRLAELQQLADDYRGQGRMLHPSFDEYAGYLGRDARLVSLVDVPGGEFDPADPAQLRFTADLDEIRTEYVDGFDLVLLRRGDEYRSRPPSDFRHVRSTRYYEVYRRMESAPAVVSHLGQSGRDAGRSPEFCRGVREQLRGAGPRARIAYVEAIGGVLVEPPASPPPTGWLVSGSDLLARGPGRLGYPFSIEVPGEYEVAIRGSFGRRVAVALDGRPVASLRWRANYPTQYEPLGTFRLAAGTHRVEAVRGGGSLLPATANELGSESTLTRIGPVAVVPARRPRPRIVEPGAGMEVCNSNRRLDWIEVVRPR